MHYETIGGGFAGKSVCIVDTGEPFAAHSHGFFAQGGIMAAVAIHRSPLFDKVGQ